MKTLDDFKDNVDLYSADLSRWPQDTVKPALQFMKENREAKDYFDASLALDDKLRGYVPKAAALNALEGRILAEIAKAPRPAVSAQETQGFSLRSPWVFAPGGGLLAAAILGFIIGLLPAQQSADTLVDPVYYSQDQIISGDSDTDTGGLF